VEAARPDIHIGMPEEDGYSLIRKIRALSPEHGANVPAIALTGYVRVEERMRALEAGYQMFVPKPVETSELIAIIGDLCRTKQLAIAGSGRGFNRRDTKSELRAIATSQGVN